MYKHIILIYMFTINDNQLIAPLEHTKYITCSSFLFFCSSFYAFQKEAYLLSGSVFVSGLMSINHWRQPTYSWRRIMDHFSAKVAFIIVIINGFYLYPAFFTYKLVCLGLVFYFYYMSDKYCNCNILINDIDPCWWKYHVCFHMCCVGSHMLVIWCI